MYQRVFTVVLLLAAFLAWTPQAQAQLLMVTGEYRVTNVDRNEQRVGVALRDDNPNKRQNWVYIKPDTVIVKRNWLGGGAFRDEFLTFNGFFDYVRKGTKFRVHGGRDWDGSIDAKKIWL